ncbi:Crp/Fnr family transcriptional regulator [Rhodovibrio salinarum]|uniref:Crp/Fnr family transcriptional regulator n=1 Tax=Rhodovibrio salinarum TaxID=1087 RepID=A0A934V1C4_9PROT|nr:Crp/Fnr family transcriptional regulator [Rhodovibrio salinarum]MBK1698668.1 Crp/Fnr family transcriptional regulator [Rhodovibrio salinarum]
MPGKIVTLSRVAAAVRWERPDKPMESTITSPGAQALFKRLTPFATLSDREQQALGDAVYQSGRRVRRGADLVAQGRHKPEGYIVLRGWAARYKTLSDGRRQVLSFLIPGDVVGLFGGISPPAVSAVTALSELEVVPFRPTDVFAVAVRSPRLTAAMIWVVMGEQEVLAEHMVSLGRRSARERVAHLFLELRARLQMRGLADATHLNVPLTQNVIADTLGLSVVHVNRTLRQLAAEGLLAVKRESVTILDSVQLCAVTGFDEDYLRQHTMPKDLDAELAKLPSRL